MKIALFGKMRSGKNTVADFLEYEHQFVQVAFGSGIGEIIEKYFPEDWNSGKKPRKHYQHIGQELRKLDEDVWINYLLRRVKELGAEHVVVTDGRQMNEAKRLKEEGFVIVKVTTPEEQRIQRIMLKGDMFTSEQLEHETEKQVDLVEADFEIINDGTLKELMEKIQFFLQGLGVLK